MNIFMEPKHLEEDELQFELRIRSMPSVITRGRVDALKKRLLSEDRNEIQPPTPLISSDIASQVSACRSKLECIESLILMAAESGCQESLEILPSRLVHVLGRLNRLISGDHRINDQIDSLKRNTESFLKIVVDARDGVTNLKDCIKNVQLSSPNVSKCADNILSGSDSFAEARSAVSVNVLGATPKTVDPRTYLPLPKDRISYIETERRTSSPVISESPGDDGGEQLSELFDLIDLNNKKDDGEIASIRRDFETSLKNKSNPQSTGARANKSFYQSNINTNQRNDSFYQENSRENRNQFSTRKEPVQNTVNGDYRQNMHNKINAGQTPYPTPTNQYRPSGNVNEFEQRIPSNNSRQRNPVPNWNIRFSGDGKGLEVHEFLAQVYLMARADRVSDQELVASAIHLFTGPARSWYIAFESLFNTWEDLTNQLRGAFVSEDSDFIILKEIEQRRQGKDETFVLYLSSLLNMFKYLQEPLTERKKVSLVMRNMSPFLADRLSLVDIQDTYHLAVLCKKIEDVRNRSRSFRQNPEENLTQNSPKRQHIYEVETAPPTPPKKVSFQNQETCWNCREAGHGFQNCTYSKMRVFCYTCGEVGQLSNQCNVCNSKKDQRRSDFRRRDNGKN